MNNNIDSRNPNLQHTCIYVHIYRECLLWIIVLEKKSDPIQNKFTPSGYILSYASSFLRLALFHKCTQIYEILGECKTDKIILHSYIRLLCIYTHLLLPTGGTYIQHSHKNMINLSEVVIQLLISHFIYQLLFLCEPPYLIFQKHLFTIGFLNLYISVVVSKCIWEKIMLKEWFYDFNKKFPAKFRKNYFERISTWITDLNSW